MIDSHCHLDFQELHPQLEDVLSRASARGVVQMVTIGASLERSQRTVNIAGVHEQIFAAVGIHPGEEAISVVNEDMADLVSSLKTYATSSKKVVAIGECGLDFSRDEYVENKAFQEQLFRAQLDLARELGLPMVMHIRDAYEEALEILADYADLEGVVHSFTGDTFDGKQIVAAGWYIGLNGIVTFGDDSLREAVKDIPLERILLETDAPFLAPIPNRGKTNEPAFLADTAQFLAELLGVSLADLDEATTRNARTLFGLPELAPPTISV